MSPEEASTLAGLVLGDPSARAMEWSESSLTGGLTAEAGLAGGVFRLRGVAESNGNRGDWSVVRKRLLPVPMMVGDAVVPRYDPGAFDYWRREADAYASGLLEDLGESLSAPRCYRIDETAEYLDLWLEDIPDVGPARWSVDDFAIAARRFGRLGGSYLVAPELPRQPWFGRGRIDDWLITGSAGIEAMPGHPRTGWLGTWLPDETVARLHRMWSERQRLLDALRALPITVCHHDATRRNLGMRAGAGRSGTFAIDWQGFGLGHLGEELAPMVAATIQFMDAPATSAVELGEAVVSAYTEGLQDAGWQGSRMAVELGYQASACLFMGLAGAGVWFAAISHGQFDDAKVERIIGQPIEEIAEQWALLQSHLLDLGEQALADIA